ncbi:polyketide cyclase [Propioniciclava coleopterorum]|uniref:Polyketide cyclase n=1 Tax=Propioniciclava coleopterorum TaxID=2714937 RepID=A0A6G7Y6L2_9ACTN|nr:SRPBCC domain-containing protein [Propioniciclava coleopterorum]QIK72423.1 polyketide cyclase [Propioniciclava coleopterorum]
MVDVDRQIDAVTRTLHPAEHDGAPAWMQTLTQRFDVSLERVWRAVTDPEHIGRWFLQVHGDFRVGGRFQLEGHAGGRILECRPPEGGHAHYTVTWAFEGAPDSWVTVTLAEAGEGRTSFELEHIARADDLPAGMWEQFGPGATGAGWDGALLGLALDLGVQDAGIGDFDAWQLGEEGRRFSRRSADAWADADVAAGTDPVTATTRANETYAFYTGQE